MKRLLADGDQLDVLARVVDFDVFRPTQMTAVAYLDSGKGGHPPYVPMSFELAKAQVRATLRLAS